MTEDWNTTNELEKDIISAVYKDINDQIEPWILKKGKEYVTIEKDNKNKGYFHLQKDEERRLSLNALQAKLTYHQLINFGYKLQKPKIQITNKS